MGHDASAVGSTLCGAYDKANFGQQPPFSLGYSGNMVHALDVAFSDVRVETNSLVLREVHSETGLSYALSLWYATRFEFVEGAGRGVVISDVVAGSRYADEEEAVLDEIYAADGPNHRPRACAVHVQDSDEFATHIVFAEGEDEELLSLRCVSGVEGCEQGADAAAAAWTHLGSVDNLNVECAQTQHLASDLLQSVAIRALLSASFVALIAVCQSVWCQNKESRWRKRVGYGSL